MWRLIINVAINEIDLINWSTAKKSIFNCSQKMAAIILSAVNQDDNKRAEEKKLVTRRPEKCDEVEKQATDERARRRSEIRSSSPFLESIRGALKPYQ